MPPAIARLLDQDGHTLLGTAFAVSPAYALTAFHCVGDRRSGEVQHRRVLLAFLTGERIEAHYAAGSHTDDYAILLLASPLPGQLAPLPLLDRAFAHEPFRAGGYPSAVERREPAERPDIFYISGEVTAPHTTIHGGAPAIQLYCHQSAARLSLRGMSGGPVLVGQEPEGVIGLVRWNLPQEDAPELGAAATFWACPAWRIAANHPQYAALLQPRRAPAAAVRAAAPFMVEDLPPDFVARPREYDQIVRHLLAGGDQTVAITAALKGAGGFGKTTLAQAVCHHRQVRQSFPDGILWATLGDDGAGVMPGLRKMYRELSGQEPRFEDQQDAARQFSRLLGDRRCLIVVDDVWDAAHLQPFLGGGGRCTRLVTTRLASVVPDAARAVAVDAMELPEAAALLAAGLGARLPGRLPDPDAAALAALARRLGEWPLLLKLVNRRLYTDVAPPHNLPLPDATAAVMAELTEFGLTAFDVADAGDRRQAVAATLGVSLKHLRAAAPYGRAVVDEPARFAELAIFPEDTALPLDTLALLWGQTGGLSPAAAERLCRRLEELALILRFDRRARTIQLHDVVRRYLIDQAPPAQYAAWQRALLAGYAARCGGQWWRLPGDGYIYQHLAWHQREAGQVDELEQLLQTYAWLDARLGATDIVSLIGDFALRRVADRHSPLGLLQHALQLSASVLARDKGQLGSQLYGRLAGLAAEHAPLLQAIEQQPGRAWLRPKTPALTPPGGNLLYSLSGHTAGVDNLLLTPDGRLITACRRSDRTVKVWDIERGRLLHTLEGHNDGVAKLLLTPDGRLLTSCGSDRDSTLKVWDIDGGRLLYSLEGHTAGVDKLLLTPDGRLISSCSSGSRAHMVKVWDIDRGRLLHSLEGHTAGVANLLLTPDGRLISSRWGPDSDPTVQVWDIERGRLLHSLEGHTAGVANLLLTPDGRLISSCGLYNDHTVKVWDIDRGRLLHSLDGHNDGVDNLLLTPDGRLITSCGSDSLDRTVKVWDIDRGNLLHTVTEHMESVWRILLPPSQGYLVTVGGSQVVVSRLSDFGCVAQFSTDGDIRACALAPDGTLLLGDGLGRVHFLTLVDPSP